VPNIAVLGSTGSIGRMTLEVAASLGPEYRVVALAAASSARRLAEQAAETGAACLAVGDDGAARALADALPKGAAPEILVGPGALAELAARDDVDVVLSAVAGGVGTLAGIPTVSPPADEAGQARQGERCGGRHPLQTRRSY